VLSACLRRESEWCTCGRHLRIWQFWALLSARFVALTAIFAKIGVERIDYNFATLIRCVVIVAFIALVVAASGVAQPLAAISTKTYLFLTLSGLATGVLWLCYYRALKLGPCLSGCAA
jgi:bacterial/archaeal transporter family protein